MTELYEVLGVKPDATPAAIKAAWRRRSQTSHPDKSNGDAELFDRIQNAYNILSDPLKRAEYDATGRVERPPPLRDHALAMLEEVLGKLFEAIDNVDGIDLVGEMSMFINGQHSQVLAALTLTQKNIRKRERTLTRLKRKKGDALLETLMHGQIAKLQARAKAQQHHLDVFKEGLAILKEYDYTFERPAPRFTTSMPAFANADIMNEFFRRTP